jgi:polysaccharide chain length determinant protein (PEP-CTERM system associated)
MTPAANAHPEAARGAGLAGILEIVRRRRVLALLPFLFVLAAAASLAIFLPGLWTSRALIFVDRQQIPESFVKSTVTGDLESQLLTLSQEILSRDRLGKIIDEQNLYAESRGSRSMDELVERMRRDIRIDLAGDRERRRDARTVAFTVAYTASDPHTAAAVANRLADLYVQENLKFRERQAAGTTEFLEGQLREVRERLQVQERRIADYKEKYIGELPEQNEANLRTMDRLQAQLQLAHENGRRANERRQLITQSLADIDQTSGMTAAGGGPNVTPADSAAARLNLLKQELAQMQTRYSDKYPDVISLKEQIRVLEGRVAQEEQQQQQQQAAAARTAPRKEGRELRAAPQNPYIVSLMQQLDQANVEAKTTADEIAALNRQIAQYQRRIENAPRREQELALLTREYDTTREQFKSLLAKRGEADMASELELRKKGESFRIIEAASLPERPTGPNRLRLLLVGVLLAAGAGALAVVLAEQVDTSYRSVDEIRASVPVPVLSTIPKITTERDRARVARQRRLATAGVALGLLAVVGSSFAIAHRNVSLVMMLMPADGATAKR